MQVGQLIKRAFDKELYSFIYTFNREINEKLNQQVHKTSLVPSSDYLSTYYILIIIIINECITNVLKQNHVGFN